MGLRFISAICSLRAYMAVNDLGILGLLGMSPSLRVAKSTCSGCRSRFRCKIRQVAKARIICRIIGAVCPPVVSHGKGYAVLCARQGHSWLNFLLVQHGLEVDAEALPATVFAEPLASGV